MSLTTSGATAITFRVYMYGSEAGTGTGGLQGSLSFGGTLTGNTPTISSTGTPAALNTTYGTISSETTFSVSGTNMTAGILVTPPSTNFEVSLTSGGTFTDTVTVGAAGTISSTPVYLRLKATATVSGSPYSGNIVLSSSGATGVNVATTSSTVSAKALTITGLTGSNKTYDGTAAASFTGTAAYAGLANGETFSVTGTPGATFASAAVGTAKPITVTGYTAPSTNYTVSQPTGLSADITPAALTVTGAAVTTKTFDGNTNAVITGTLTGVIGGDDVTFIGTGAFANAGPGTGIAVTSTSTLGGAASGNYTLTQPTGLTGDILPGGSPTITLTGTLGGQSTTYGTASAGQNFLASGTYLTGNLTVTAPAGFEVSKDGTNFGGTVILPVTGDTVGETTITVRLKATTGAAINFSGNVTVSGGGAAQQTISTGLNTVNQKTLVVAGYTILDKVYDGTRAATYTGTPYYVGLVNGDMLEVPSGLYFEFGYDPAVVGNGIDVIGQGYEASTPNYNFDQPGGFANMTPKPLTVMGAAVTSKAYNGSTAAVITGSLNGVIAGDVVVFNGTGIFTSANVGTGIAVTSTSTLTGAAAGNYTLTQPTGLTGDITQGSQTITGLPTTLSKLTTDAAYNPGATASSGLTVSYASSNPAVATVSGSTITIVGAGVTTITASQAGDTNWAAATPVTQTLTVTAAQTLLAGWDFSTTTNGGTVAVAAPSPLVYVSNFGAGTIYFDGTNGSSTWLTPASNPEVTGFAGTSVNAGAGFATTGIALAIANQTANGKKAIFKFNMTGQVNLNVTYAAQRTGTGFSSHLWEYSTDGTNWTTAQTISSIASSFAVVTLSPITGLNRAANAYLRLTVAGASAASGNNRIDNIQFKTEAAGPAPTLNVTGTPTTFSTTYGVASAVQTFPVSGTNLEANIVATAPAGFEVSADGTTYGSTANFVPTSGAVTGATLSVRLAATAAVTGTYDAKNIVVSSLDATSFNLTTPASGNTVSAVGLTIAGLTGTSRFYDGTTTASFTGTAAYVGLVNGETFTVTGTPSASFATAAAEVGKTIAVTGYTAPSANYTLTQPALTADITPAPLTITANDVSKGTGVALTGGPGSTAFTTSGLIMLETVSSVTITYGSGAGAGDPAGSYPGSVVASAAVFGSGSASNYAINYVPGTINVSATPTISLSGTLSAVNAVYGTASPTPTTFTVSGVNLTGDLTVLAPTGYRVSLESAANYGTSITVPASGTLSPTTVYVRLGGTTPVGSYSGDVTVSGGGATSKTIATVASTVSAKGLTITGVSGVDKTYNRTNAASLSGTPTLVGVVGSDDVSVSGTPTATFASVGVASAVSITVTGYTLSGSAAGNYSVAQPTGLSANITPAALTVTSAAVTTKAYDGTTAATITGTLAGIFSPDVVTLVGTGTFADANAGTGIAVTSTSTLSGAAAGNYVLTQPTGLTGTITQAAAPAISFAGPGVRHVGDTPVTLTATTNPTGLTVSFASSNPSVATVSGSTLTIVGLGTATITASRDADQNYAAATPVVRTLTVVRVPILAWDFTGENQLGTSVSDVTDTNLNSSTLSRGLGATASVGANSFRTTSFQNNGIATSNTDYFEFTVSAKAGYTLSLSAINAAFNGTASFAVSPGVASQFAYSLDGTTFTLIGTAANIIGAPANSPEIDLSGITALQNLPDTATVTFRYYASGQTPTGGWGFSSSAAGQYGLEIVGLVDVAGTAPSFTQEPAASQIIVSGNTATLTALAAGAPTPTYQWYEGVSGDTSHPVSGATDVSFTTPALTAATSYWVKATNVKGSANSHTANVLVAGGTISFAASGTLSVNPLTTSGLPNTVAVTIHRSNSTGGASVTVTASSPTTVPNGQVKLLNTTDYTLGGNVATVSFANGDSSAVLNIPLKTTTRFGQFQLVLSDATGGAAADPAVLVVQVLKKDTTAPAVTLSTMAIDPVSAGVVKVFGTITDGAATATSNGLYRVELINVSVTGTHTTILTVTPTPASPNPNVYDYAQNIQLDHGVNKLTVNAYDNSGKKGTRSLSVSYSNPAVTGLAGTYSGLLLPDASAASSNDTLGLLTLKSTAGGVISGKLTVGGIAVALSGALDNAGNVYFKATGTKYFNVIDKTEFESYLGALSVRIVGTVATGKLEKVAGGDVLANVSANVEVALAATPIAGSTTAGQKYTVVFPSKAQTSVTSGNYPQGDGYAAVTVKPNGSVSATGALADGTTYSASGKLHPLTGGTQSVTLYSMLYAKKGAFATELVFDQDAATHSDSDVLGTGGKWIRPALPRSRYYPLGWTAGAVVDAKGARYTVPTTVISVLPNLTTQVPNAQLQFEAGSLVSTLNLNGVIAPNNTFTNKSTDLALKLSISKAAGTFSGTFTHSDNTKPAFKGIIVQEGSSAGGYGFFRSTPPNVYNGTGLGGGVSLIALPATP